jgi:hypothetical protein
MLSAAAEDVTALYVLLPNMSCMLGVNSALLAMKRVLCWNHAGILLNCPSSWPKQQQQRMLLIP